MKHRLIAICHCCSTRLSLCCIGGRYLLMPLPNAVTLEQPAIQIENTRRAVLRGERVIVYNEKLIDPLIYDWWIETVPGGIHG